MNLNQLNKSVSGKRVCAVWVKASEKVAASAAAILGDIPVPVMRDGLQAKTFSSYAA